MTPDTTSTELRMSAVAAGQFSYHVRMSASCAIAGQAEESASEAVLAWSMLCTAMPGAPHAAAAVAAELIDPDRVLVTAVDRGRARGRAQDLALSLEAHFVSVGLHEHAALYEAVAGHLETAVSALGEQPTPD